MIRRLEPIGGPLLLAFFPLFVFSSLWAAAPGETQHFYGDTTASYWPDLVFFWRSLTDGSFPLWNPADRGGFPFAADPQPGVFYPVNWLLAGLGALLGAMPYWVMQLKVLLHLSAMGLAMYVFLRGRGLPRIAATLGGVLHQFGPFVMENGHFSLLWPLVWLPLALAAIDRLFAPEQRRPGRPAVGLGLAGAMMLVAGSPPAAFYGLLVAGPYFLLRFAQRLRASSPAGSARRVLIAAVAALVIAGGLALPQLAATFVLMKHSVLATPSFRHAARGSVASGDLVGLVLRSGYERFLYVGVTALFLAAVGFVRGRRRSDAWFFLVLSFVSVLLVLGRHGFLLRTACAVFPPFTWFRLTFRYLYLLNVGVPVLAAWGVAALLRREGLGRVVFRVGAGLWALLAAMALFFRIGDGIASRPSLVSDLWGQSLLFGMTLVSLWVASRRGRLLGPAALVLLAVVCTDVGMHATRADLLRKGSFQIRERLGEARRAALLEDADVHRIWDEFVLQWRPGSRLGLRDFRGYMDPLRLQRYADVVGQIAKRPELLEIFNVRWVLQGRHPYHGTGHRHVENPRKIPGARRVATGLYELANPAPRAWWVGHARRHETKAALLASLTTERVAQEAQLLAGDPVDASLRLPPPASPGTETDFHAAQVREAGNNHVSFEIDAPAEGLLVVNESWFPGWRALVDGEEQPLLRANYLVGAVPVPAGRHQVDVQFRPLWILVPAALAGALLFALLVWGVWERRRGARG